MDLKLHQFAFSHFNEKARWALAWKDLDCERITYLPGPHMGPIKRLSGATTTPVLEADGEVISGSAAIIDFLERAQAEPPLYPTDEDQRREALALQERMDAELGPAVRTALFSALVNEGGYLCQMFAGSKGPLKRAAYRATFPLARGLIAKGNGVTDPANVAACFRRTEEALDWLAEAAAVSGYLVGNAFSVADLTAAALLAPIANVDHPDMKRPDPMPTAVAGIIAQFAEHPAIAWVGEVYRKHRPS